MVTIVCVSKKNDTKVEKKTGKNLYIPHDVVEAFDKMVEELEAASPEKVLKGDVGMAVIMTYMSMDQAQQLETLRQVKDDRWVQAIAKKRAEQAEAAEALRMAQAAKKADAQAHEEKPETGKKPA
jgi:hypothetical protein